ncbi:hypothetical protein [Spirosoma fluviale]|uniref:Uncharacterized protein n=1 Tax=Spirosoma fluviale TaxID=1597977 RepID=A0A286GLJ8_9BACT|nr:hypothetical protein [Spirosoma fluviale]SOD95854.1 hypothetical protein SAMN06269250_5015 [Spirosoma fluviale]
MYIIIEKPSSPHASVLSDPFGYFVWFSTHEEAQLHAEKWRLEEFAVFEMKKPYVPEPLAGSDEEAEIYGERWD